MLSFEGRIRDLALAEVVQLLARGRKSGVLWCEAPLLSRRARLSFHEGTITDAAVMPLDRPPAEPPAPVLPPDQELAESALELLGWTDGRFRFQPEAAPTGRGHLAVEPLLFAAAQRALVWDRIRALVPHARVIPAFADLDASQLPELRLAPPQWDLLAHIDGARDLRTLAATLQREVTVVAELVHGLVAIGLLTVHEAPAVPRCNPTPPVNAALPPIDDLWIPDRDGEPPVRQRPEADPAGDTLFDPVQVGVLTPEGLPALAPPPAAHPGPHVGREAEGAPVAQPTAEPSLIREPVGGAESTGEGSRDGRDWCREGDARLRHGDLMGAVPEPSITLPAPVTTIPRSLPGRWRRVDRGGIAGWS